MEKRNTKELILLEALTLFSTKGYDGVSVRDIAGKVGIKESSLYKHYKNKQDIFDSILKEMAVRYEFMSHQIQLPDGNQDAITNGYKNLTRDMLCELCIGVFLFFLKDDFAAKFRRMITIEQYKNSYASHTFLTMFIKDPIQYQSMIFQKFIEDKTFIDCDANTAALHFYSPIYLMLCKYDQHIDQENDAINELKAHVIQFQKLYSI